MIYKNIFFKKTQIEIEDSLESIVHEVLDGAKMSGTNLWLLLCATIIACIGLINNSISAVIGAMLLSPLMGPIVALGTGLAIRDNRMVKKVLINWFWLIVISILCSVLFFIISPYTFLTSQIKSFTEATIYDVLLAFVGGIAGFVGVVRKDGVKILAGVAVATSCIPPLAVCSYGIVMSDWKIALGGLYYYLINCSFIALGTYLTAIYLKLPKKEGVDSYNFTLWIVNLLFFLPAVFIMVQNYRKLNIDKNIEQFLSTSFKEEILLKSDYDHNTQTLSVSLLENATHKLDTNDLKVKLKLYGLESVKLKLHETLEINNTNFMKTLNDLYKQNAIKDSLINKLEIRLNKLEKVEK